MTSELLISFNPLRRRMLLGIKCLLTAIHKVLQLIIQDLVGSIVDISSFKGFVAFVPFGLTSQFQIVYLVILGLNAIVH